MASAKDGSHDAPRIRSCRRNPFLAFGLTGLAIAVGLAGASSFFGQGSKPKEYEVKATYLYNFARFVEWPAGPPAAANDSFAICVLGQDPFGATLDAIVSGEAIAGKAVVARRITKPQEALSCRVLFVSSSEDGRLQEILAALGNRGVLTVSDMPQFSSRGGMIQFVSNDKKIRFQVNLAKARAAELTLSSELLKVAVTVHTSPPPGD